MVEVTEVDVVELHLRIVSRTGGSLGLHDLGALQAALAQPAMTFDGEELYPSLAEKAAALAYSLVLNHPFLDGNKRIGHAAMRLFLLRNDYRIDASVDEQEEMILRLAAGELSRQEWTAWLEAHIVEVAK
jgi:death on curing protein